MKIWQSGRESHEIIKRTFLEVRKSLRPVLSHWNVSLLVGSVGLMVSLSLACCAGSGETGCERLYKLETGMQVEQFLLSGHGDVLLAVALKLYYT